MRAIAFSYCDMTLSNFQSLMQSIQGEIDSSDEINALEQDQTFLALVVFALVVLATFFNPFPALLTFRAVVFSRTLLDEPSFPEARYTIALPRVQARKKHWSQTSPPSACSTVWVPRLHAQILRWL